MNLYRPDIDGLRGLAIIYVIIFHCFHNVLPSGFIGVDVFFVISGFLITRIILGQLENNKFRFFDFYCRRIRRIFPALFVMLLVSFCFGLLTLSSGDMVWLTRQFHYAAFQISNIFFQRTVSYFDEGQNFMPLLHTWSLGIEEQFYLVAPFILFASFRLKSSSSISPFRIILILSLISLGLSQYFVFTNQKIAFYSIFSRFWELGIGCILAFNRKIDFSKKIQKSLIFGSLLIVPMASFAINSKNFPGVMALFPCLGAAMIILIGEVDSKNFVTKFLSGRILVFIGKLSYSLYLWHLPILAFYKDYTNQTNLSALTIFCLLLVMFGVSYLSWKFVETPFRGYDKSKYSDISKLRYFKNPFFVAALVLAIFFSISTFSKKTNGVSSRLSNNILTDDTLLDQYAAFSLVKICGVAKKSHNFPSIEECVIGKDKDNFQVVLFGDSHAGHYASSVVKWAESRELSVAALYLFSCPPILTKEDVLNKDKRCGDYRKNILKILEEKKGIEYVFLGSSWFGYEEKDPNYEELFRKNFAETVRIINNMGKKLIVLGRVPDFNINGNASSPLKCVEKNLVPMQKIFPISSADCDSMNLSEFAQQIKFNNLMKSEVEKYSGSYFFDPYPYFCDQKKCSSIKNDKLLYADRGHMNKNGAHYLEEYKFAPLNIK